MEKLKSEYEVVFTEPNKDRMIEASTAVVEAYAKDKGLEELAAAIAAAK